MDAEFHDAMRELRKTIVEFAHSKFFDDFLNWRDRWRLENENSPEAATTRAVDPICCDYPLGKQQGRKEVK